MCFTTIISKLFSKTRTKDIGEYIVETKNLDYECLICLDEFKQGQQIIMIKCGHLYHKPCIDKWFLKKKTCPLCDEQLTI
jgi:hypothetical protein